MTSFINYRTTDFLAVIEMNKPPVNAIDGDLIEGLIAALRRAGEDPDIRAVVMTSAIENMFCGGLDINFTSGMSGEELRALLEKLYVELYDVQYGLGKPTIAALNGAARAGGVTIAVSCDVVIAEKQATLGYPEVKVGLIPGIHFMHLPQQIGRHKAFELLFTGDPITADEAERLGLINRVVPQRQALEAASSLARKFAAISPTVMRQGRNAYMSVNDHDFRRDVAAVVDAMCALVETDASQEGLRAFVEKRKPDW